MQAGVEMKFMTVCLGAYIHVAALHTGANKLIMGSESKWRETSSNSDLPVKSITVITRHYFVLDVNIMEKCSMLCAVHGHNNFAKVGNCLSYHHIETAA